MRLFYMNPKDILNAGGILLYPTDTLYGLGVDALNVEALKKLRTLKGREEGKPISIVVSDMKMAEEYAEVTPLALKLTEAFLPGKLTLILKAKSNLPTELTAGTGTVGIRIPNHVLCLNIVRELGRPYTTTSANVSDMDSKNTVSEILAQFGAQAGMIDRIIDVGELLESLPSTVVDARGLSPHVIREGAISEIDIHAL
ncbi:MAG: tRNA threonylcarbamoyladenosine biosynthesis protein [Parcubacteria group bacterium Greene0714_7]|nr:MAG: tRNA threonylcarbamoyladenosine biosynthesis protein [Parcubacteria group bacterium Greene0714_7]